MLSVALQSELDSSLFEKLIQLLLQNWVSSSQAFHNLTSPQKIFLNPLSCPTWKQRDRTTVPQISSENIMAATLVWNVSTVENQEKNNNRSEILTDGCAAVQVPEVVQFVSQLHQFGLGAAVWCMFHLLTLPFLLGQAFVICHLLNNTGHNGSKCCLDFCYGSVCILYGVMKKSSLWHKTTCSLNSKSLPQNSIVQWHVAYLQNLNVHHATFMAEDSGYSLKVYT